MEIKLTLPEPNLKIKSVNSNIQVFDPVRRKFVVLTPEERVRQYLISFLNKNRDYPLGLMKLEQKIYYNEMLCRADILIYNNKVEPVMLIECKAPYVKLTQDIFDQIAKYNYSLKAPYLLVSNGVKHFCCHIDYKTDRISFLEDIPSFSETH